MFCIVIAVPIQSYLTALWASAYTSDDLDLPKDGPYRLMCSLSHVISAGYQDLLMAAADKRLGLATEVINNIKVVKFFAWVGESLPVNGSTDVRARRKLTNSFVSLEKETNFLQKMQVLREAELAMLFKRLLVNIGESTVSFSVPIFVSIVTFYTHTKVLGKSLTAEEAFTALALFNVFRFPLSVLVGVSHTHKPYPTDPLQIIG